VSTVSYEIEPMLTNTHTNKRLQVNSSAIQRVNFESCCSLNLYSMFIYKIIITRYLALRTKSGHCSGHYENCQLLYYIYTDFYFVLRRSFRNRDARNCVQLEILAILLL